MKRNEEFERWYEEYFGNAQGEDSPYTYNDVKMAFYKGFSKGKESIKKLLLFLTDQSDFMKRARLIIRNSPEKCELRCHKCNKKFVNAVDSKTGEISEYLWRTDCCCKPELNDLRICIG